MATVSSTDMLKATPVETPRFRWIGALLIAALIVFTVVEVIFLQHYAGCKGAEWTATCVSDEWRFIDVGGILGLVVAIALVFVSQSLTTRYRRSLQRLLEDRVLVLEKRAEGQEGGSASSGLPPGYGKICGRGNVAGALGAVTLSACLLWAAIEEWPEPLSEMSEAWLIYGAETFQCLTGLLICAAAGFYLFRLISFSLAGFLSQQLAGPGYRLVAQLRLNHLDKVCGLKPIGSFYLGLVVLLSLPFLYSMLWWILMDAVRDKDLAWWTLNPDLVPLMATVMGFFILCQIVVFFGCLLPFHLRLKAFAVEQADDAVRVSREVADLREELAGGAAPERRHEIEQTVAQKTRDYEAMTAVPRWPITAKGWKNLLAVIGMELVLKAAMWVVETGIETGAERLAFL